MSSKRVRDFVYHSPKFRGLPEYHCVALAKHLANYLELKKEPVITHPQQIKEDVE